ncbi:cysteine--tRNA ligase [Aerococcaceae bacterium NML190073]|nr:cysteine--tRNA ligase [Aerococcaceae bacterium NML190073]
MSIQLYNTLTRRKELFTPIKPNEVSFYVCGPTVYYYIHIGNARSAVAFDTIRRYLEYRGYQVNYVSNFTDVDDKIIRAAKEEGISPAALADKYIAAFKEDTSAINIKPASIHPRVMENIEEIIEFIQQLIDKDYAYESDGDVYFRTEKFETYGELSDQSIKDLLAGASERVELDETERKESPIHFALWKKTKSADEISWQSPWSDGRPGWHIECSVMATKYLGHTIDIHGGGQDLEFPHHENEIAQSECCTGHKFANYWLHNGFVTIGQDDEKMSKSLGNFVLLRDLLEEYDPMVVRYLLSTVHYRRPVRYSTIAIQEAQTNVEKLREVLRRINHRLNDASDIVEEEWQAQLAGHQQAFITAMDDDVNASNGITEIFNLVKAINRYLEGSVSKETLTSMKQLLSEQLAIFGLELEEETLLDDSIMALIEERTQARLNKDYARSDEIRDLLKSQGILLDDTPQGTTWKRVN